MVDVEEGTRVLFVEVPEPQRLCDPLPPRMPHMWAQCLHPHWGICKVILDHWDPETT